MKSYFRLGKLRLFRAPVYFHLSAFVAMAVVGFISTDGVLQGLVAAFSYIGVLVLHEAGHAGFVRWQGLRPIAIRINAIHGLCEFEEPESAKQDYIIAWGGVAAQLAVAIPLLAADLVFGIGNIELLGPVVAIFGFLSLLIVAFNLIPAPPLDGAKAWRLIPLLLAERREQRFVPSHRRRRKLKVLK